MTYTYKAGKEPRELLLYCDGKCFGYVREPGLGFDMYVVKVYGFQVYTELTLAAALRSSQIFHQSVQPC